MNYSIVFGRYVDKCYKKSKIYVRIIIRFNYYCLVMNNTFIKKSLLSSVCSITALLTVTAHADTPIYQYKDDGGQVFLTNIQQNTGGTSKFTQVSVTYYPDTKLHGNGQIPSTYDPTTASSPSRSANRNAFDHLIRAAATRHGVDPALVKAIIHTESAFNPNARSPVGAMGLMQLMPGTARDMGVSNAWNPAQNIEGGVKYIAWLKRQLNSLDHVIAAYNAGLGNVRKYGGIPPFRETQNYVRSVNGRYKTLYRNDANLLNGYLAQATPVQSTPQAVVTPVRYSSSGYNTQPSTGSSTSYATPPKSNHFKWLWANLY